MGQEACVHAEEAGSERFRAVQGHEDAEAGTTRPQACAMWTHSHSTSSSTDMANDVQARYEVQKTFAKIRASAKA
jgi:hypothetical protein